MPVEQFIRVLLHRQPIYPNCKRIIPPGIQCQSQCRNVLEIHRARVLACPLNAPGERGFHRHPGPPSFTERKISEKIAPLGRLDLNCALLSIQENDWSRILETRQVRVYRLDPKA